MSKHVFKEIPPETLTQQRRASNPNSSVWVAANAGSGKTHVLAERVIRLLLSGAEPSAIVCLTYTKAAATLMANRVFQRLASWTSLGDNALRAEITQLEDIPPDNAKLSDARRLFARALETPGGLKIQTIHAFCQMILGRFPLEANIAGHFELLDDETALEFRKEAQSLLLSGALDGRDAGLRDAVSAIVARYGEHAVLTLLENVRKNRLREELESFAAGFGGNGVSAAQLSEFLGIGLGDDEAGLLGRSWPLQSFPSDMMRAIGSLEPQMSGVYAPNFANAFSLAARSADPVERYRQLRRVLKKGEHSVSNQKVIVGALRPHFPEIEKALDQFNVEMSAIADELKRLVTLNLTVSGFHIIKSALNHYAALKERRSMLDHDDVINRTVRLLTRSGAAAWVQYKLDQGIDHILVDEAQDTSPPQWKVIRSLADEFFAGNSARGLIRTLFAVGDEKQSIYSFQGARPEVFAATGRDLRDRAKSARLPFGEARLNLSFRSTADVLSAVDQVFKDESNRRGLSFDDSYNDHESIRVHGPGRVEVWPVVGAGETDEVPQDWTLGRGFETRPAVRLAAAIATTIHAWMRAKRVSQATGRIIQPRDIMVLVRKRGVFVNALSRELKSRGVAVSGVDRLILTSHIAVKDLLAIAKFCLMPEDDLSLASLLRSPVFAISDDDLTTLAALRPRQVSLVESLRQSALSNRRHADIAEVLARWRSEAARLSVFDFYAGLLGRDRLRARFIQRLGIEAGDVIDEFLNYAIASERAGISGLQAFVATLESAAPEIKRELDASHNEVRLMTVHAAKGQEAPVIFLVDPPPPKKQHDILLSVSQSPPLFVWEPFAELASSKTRPFHAEKQARQSEEFRRLLYVGMTRAEDHLIICSFAGKTDNGNSENWRSMAHAALSSSDRPVNTEAHPLLDGETLVWQITSGEPPPTAVEEAGAAAGTVAPSWLLTRMPRVRPAPQTLSAAGAALLIEPQSADEPQSPVLMADKEPYSFAVQRGLMMHKLLELLPDLPGDQRRTAAARYLDRAASGWAQKERDALLEQTFSVLDDIRFSPVFADGSRAEVSITGKLRIRGEERAVSGKIDRIAVLEDQVLLIDFKTGPVALKEIPQAYVMQLALYRALVAPLYPQKKVNAALLFTQAATLHSLPGDMLDRALDALADS